MCSPPRRSTVAGVRPAEHPATDEIRRLVPASALAVSVVAVLVDPAPAAQSACAVVPVLAFGAWVLVPGVPLAAAAVAVIAAVTLGQAGGDLEPLMFQLSVLAFAVGRWIGSLRIGAPLVLASLAVPVVVGEVLVPEEDIGVGVWVLGILFPWLIALAVTRQIELAAQLDATRTELAEQARWAERREIARDVHDLVGHGLAAVMLHVTGARHVLRRDVDAAEDALRQAEEHGRRSMRELRQALTLLRGEDEHGVAPPLPTTRDIATLVDDARAAGLAAELHVRGDLSAVGDGVGVAAYRIAQEALSNAARHAPQARTVLEVALDGDGVEVVAQTTGPLRPAPDGAGYGLVGMRERAAALGGSCEAGPAGGGWRVRCHLPVREPA
jgi:signal transduction histidine kinase